MNNPKVASINKSMNRPVRGGGNSENIRALVRITRGKIEQLGEHQGRIPLHPHLPSDGFAFNCAPPSNSIE